MPTYNEMVGDRLRSMRRQRGYSLQDVQRVSQGEFKAAVLGAYERGERSLSLPRLRRLADFFDVPVTQLLPADSRYGVAITEMPSAGLTIDLNKVESLGGSDAVLIDRFLRAIQIQRQDFNGKVLTVRKDDLRLLATLLGDAEEQALDRLNTLGVGPA